MSVQPLRKDGDRNPRTIEEAGNRENVESLFMPWNIDALVDGSTDDCVVRSAPSRSPPAMRCVDLHGAQRKAEGLPSEEALSRSDEMTQSPIYRPANGRMLTAKFPMREVGVEVWVMRDGRSPSGKRAFNVARADESSSLANLLTR